MRFVVCYDIADDRRRERVAHSLLDFGRRIQESVFLATLDEELMGKMMGRLEKLIDATQDSIFVFSLCAGCSRRVRSLGVAEVPHDRNYYIV